MQCLLGGNLVHSNFNNKLDRVMTTEQFTQVVDAILEGKYSWACVLILRFAGYNPLHYIPYRTYNRLMKENNPVHRHNKNSRGTASQHSSSPSQENYAGKITDLAYLESVNEPHSNVRGGNRFIQFFN